MKALFSLILIGSACSPASGGGNAAAPLPSCTFATGANGAWRLLQRDCAPANAPLRPIGPNQGDAARVVVAGAAAAAPAAPDGTALGTTVWFDAPGAANGGGGGQSLVLFSDT
ncbi:hypothetical protein MNEG_16636, partial [Monoraphidium neglectum]